MRGSSLDSKRPEVRPTHYWLASKQDRVIEASHRLTQCGILAEADGGERRPTAGNDQRLPF